MQLQEFPVTLKFAGGVETKMDSKAVPTVRLLGLENGVFTRAISIKKRNGYTARARTIDGSVALLDGARRNAVRDNEYLVFTKNRCFSQQSGENKWTDVGPVICATGSDRPAVHTSTAQTMPDHATHGGVTVYAWEDSRGGVWWTAVDSTNGHVYRAPAQADAAGQRPRCIAVGGVLHIYFAIPTLRQIKVAIVNPATPTAEPVVRILVDDLDSGTPTYDAASTARFGTPGVIAWHEHATRNVRCGYVTVSGQLGSPVSGHPSVHTLVGVLQATDVLIPFGFTLHDPLAVAHRYIDGADADRIVVGYVGGASASGIVHVLNGGSSSTPIGSTLSSANIAYANPDNITRLTLSVAGDSAQVVFEEEAVQASERYCVANTASLTEPRTMASALFRNSALTPIRWVDDGSDPTARNEWSLQYAEHVGGDFFTVTFDSLNKLVILDFRSSIGSFGFGIVAEIIEATGLLEAPGWPAGSFARPTPGPGAQFSGGIAGVDVERTIRSVGLVSRAFDVDSDAFAVFVHDTIYFNTYLTLRLSDFLDVGRHLPASACGPTRTHLSTVHVEDGVAKVALPYRTRLASLNNDKFTESGTRLVSMDFTDDDSHQCAQIGRGLYMVAASPQHFDGASWTEQGFHMGPEHIPTPALSGSGALTTDVTYAYKFWYEWTDRQGEIHRGPESVALSVETGSDSKATFQVPTLRVTRKENVRICVARSLPGDTSELFRVNSLDPTTAGADNGYLANDKTVDSVTFVDAMSDADLRKQEKLYTTGGILSNDPAPLGSLVCVGKNRLFFTDAQNGSVVRFSQRIAHGYGVEVAPELAHDVDPEGGDITALAYMDDVIYAFKRSMIWAFNGDGPLETGQVVNSGPLSSGFSASQKISADIGCADPSSIGVARDGIYFKSEQGIYLLKRSREVVYVGAPVEAYNDQTVRRACVLPKRPGVVFLTDSGKTLYYDYQFGQWSTFTNHEGYDAAVVDGVYQYLRKNSIVYREDLTSHSDAGSRVKLRFETAWIRMTEHLQGFQRFWRMLLLGTWSSPHQLGMQYRMSYDEAWSDPTWFDATGGTDPTGWLSGEGVMTVGADPVLGSNYGDGNYGDGPYGGAGPDVYQWRYGIFEGGQAIQFRFEDFEKAGLSGASFELTEMTIIGGVMKPDVRPFSGARSM